MSRRSFSEGGPFLHYVYVLQSQVDPDRFYVGETGVPDRRVAEHNAGKSIHTNKYKPWKLCVCIGFSDRTKAISFEKYLKSG
jgi:predicted GIY-YIG superfamily endonuclease